MTTFEKQPVFLIQRVAVVDRFDCICTVEAYMSPAKNHGGGGGVYENFRGVGGVMYEWKQPNRITLGKKQTDSNSQLIIIHE
jgi:hypothetical protein